MIQTFKFKKDITHRWYIDLPWWTGEHSDLEMVMGADTMLDILAQGEAEVMLTIGDQLFDCYCSLKLTNIDEDGRGATYQLDSYNGIDYNLSVWLCEVTLSIFINFPEAIYLRNI